MGANAQIAVPAFTAGQVLTAAQQTQINTGIPVFATTVTRDAAFGGAGEKTLAQGQYAYIEATSSLQVYSGSAWISASPAKLGQVVQSSLTTATNTTSTSFVTTGLNATITPTSTSSTVLVMYASNVGSPSSDSNYTTVFRGTVAGTNLGGGTGNGLSESYSTAGGSLLTSVAGIVLDSPATTSAQIYTVGFKTGSGTSNFNVRTKATLTLIEVLA